MSDTKISAARVTKLSDRELEELADAAEEAVKVGGGFGWLKPPPRHVMEAFWRGVLLIPERMLFVGRVDDTVAGSALLQKPPRNNEAQAHSCWLTTSFVAPWARGHGLANLITETVEIAAREAGYKTLNLDVRETQSRAIEIYRHRGYVHWGTNPRYARVNGEFVAGLYFYKVLNGDEA
ncbi:MAG: GNAT family N-acetyltransferase [Alphaproteobacteria bacterium]|nr:GNAT family N-acetyltransferase [Alphaproteobacteria bacterium]